MPVSVQPDSSQMCLLGMNAIPWLGIKVTSGNGKVLCGISNSDDNVGQSECAEPETRRVHEPRTVSQFCSYYS